MNANDQSRDTAPRDTFLHSPTQVFVFDFREPTAEDLARPRYGRPVRTPAEPPPAATNTPNPS